ncbi:MAG: hypothetical protein AAF212_12785, partial [Verrucomicrobiota bacterium]
MVFGALWKNIGGLQAFTQFFDEYQEEFWNTIRVGVCSALFASVLSYAWVLLGRLWGGSRWQLGIVCLSIFWMVPPVLLGIGWVALWRLPIYEVARLHSLELYVIGAHTALVFIPILALLGSVSWRRQHNETLDVVGAGTFPRILLINHRLKGVLGVLSLAGFAVVAREVPAGLLNMPPGQSTLAVSIETLLHFEQPDRVAALCIAYMGAVVIAGGLLYVVAQAFDYGGKYMLLKRLR